MECPSCQRDVLPNMLCVCGYHVYKCTACSFQCAAETPTYECPECGEPYYDDDPL